ncbi:MAG: hypothetical protein HY904_16335 [Deltaproteobacteria bacterium]|nr:hypothetical protein [Deltaproteobacteria bacterium]
MQTFLGAFLAGVLVVVPAAAAPLKVAVVDLTVGEGAAAGMAGPLTQAVVAEVRKVGGTEVLTREEIAAVLTLEQQKQLLGCTSDKCRAELGSLLGVDRLLMGDLGRLGESWLLHLKLLDVRQARVVSQVDRRQKGGTVDDLLDALPAMVKQLLAGEVKDPGAPVAAAAVAPVVAARTPRHGADEPMPAAPAGLDLLTDGKGRYLAYRPGALDTLFAGDGKELREAWVSGGGRSGTESWDQVFWDPRVAERWRASVGMRHGVYTLQCGETAVTLRPVPDAEEQKLLKQARFLKARWQRRPHLFGRDDLGNYFLVDERRDKPGTDLRLYVGRKGALKPVVVEDAMVDRGGLVLITPTGRLKLDRKADTLEWLEGQATTKLKNLDVEEHHVLIYTDLGVYRTEPLGTPCDGLL